MVRRSGAPIARKAGLRSTFKKTLPPCRIRNAMPVFNRQTRNAPNNAPKHLNQEGNHQRSRIEVESQRAIYGTDSVIHYTLRRKLITTATSLQHHYHHHLCHRPLHDAGDALLSRDLTTATSCQHHHQCPPPAIRPRGRARGRAWGLKKKKKTTNNTRVKKRKRTTMGKSLPRGGMTVAAVKHRVVGAAIVPRCSIVL
jgi:hypothetical protein